MRTPRRAALLPAVAIGALLATTVAAPALAAPPLTTWYVAPGGPVPTEAVGGSCATPDTGSIQAAVDLSGPGDTIIVCDGTYPGTAALIQGHAHDGLALIGETPWGATLLPPTTGTAAGIVAVNEADGVTIARLRFKTLASCADGPFGSIVVFQSRGVDVRANRIIGQDPEGDCAAEVGIMSNQSTGRIRYNLLVDWGFAGIDVAFADADTGRMTVSKNSLQFAPPSMPPRPNARFGIAVDSSSATAQVRLAGNVVTVAKAIRGGPTSAAVLFGIAADANHLTIRDNRVGGAGIALTVDGTTDVLVEGNRVRGLIRDCVGLDGQVWQDNDGRPDRSDPVGLCTVGG